MYPSLDIEETSKICAKMVTESGLRFQGVDWTWACKYLALNFNQKEISKRNLLGIIPVKKAKQGKDPTVLTIGPGDKK